MLRVLWKVLLSKNVAPIYTSSELLLTVWGWGKSSNTDDSDSLSSLDKQSREDKHPSPPSQFNPIKKVAACPCLFRIIRSYCHSTWSKADLAWLGRFPYLIPGNSITGRALWHTAVGCVTVHDGDRMLLLIIFELCLWGDYVKQWISLRSFYTLCSDPQKLVSK